MAYTLEDIAAMGLTTALGFAFKASPVSIGTASSAMEMAGKALITLAAKTKDGKITPEELQEVIGSIQGDAVVVLAVKSAVGRIVEQLF